MSETLAEDVFFPVLKRLKVVINLGCPSCGREAQVVLNEEGDPYSQHFFDCGHCGRHTRVYTVKAKARQLQEQAS